MQELGRKKIFAGIWESVLKVRLSGDGPVMVMFQSSHSGENNSNPTLCRQGCMVRVSYARLYSDSLLAMIVYLFLNHHCIYSGNEIVDSLQ